MSSQMAGAHGCGCGSTVAAPGGCGCGGRRASDHGTAQDGAFARPTFFAGQLLTEQDLEALGTYVRGKNRLHNRYLVGSGVVCGLEVRCGAPGSACVVVGSGYALDCCGNDVVLPCDQAVDINGLVAELPRLGDCVEPCPPPMKGTGDAPAGDPTSGSTAKDGVLPRYYELVVEYAETPAEPVEAFVTDEGGARACEPSRIKEGYRFSLRCASDRPEPAPSLLDALKHCAHLGRAAGDLVDRLHSARDVATNLVDAQRRPPQEGATQAEVDEAVAEFGQNQDLSHALQLASLAARAARAARTDQAERARTALQTLRDGLETVRRAAEADPILSAQARALTERVGSLERRLEPDGGRAPADDTDQAAIPFESTTGDDLLGNGIAVSDELRQTLRSVVAEGRDWALSHREGESVYRCRATAALARLTVDVDDPVALRNAARAVAEAVQRVIQECVCSAINPPCVPCVDVAVPLAVITVEGCEVTEVCQAVRRYALTGAALRYWIPLEPVYDEIEELCCADDGLRIVAALRDLFGGRDEDHREPATNGASVTDHLVSAAPTSGEAPGPDDARLLRMLNSQVQKLQRRLAKIDQTIARAGLDG